MDYDHTQTLREAGFRATPGRLAILETLSKAKSPLTIDDLSKKLRGQLNLVTLYRALHALVSAGIINQILLGNNMRFEYTPQRPHHHHVVCTDCGTIEDVEVCPLPILPKVKKFNSYSHTLEFSGLCQTCA